MILLDKYKGYISYRNGSLPGFIRDVLDSEYNIEVTVLVIDDTGFRCVIDGVTYVRLEDMRGREFDDMAAYIIERIRKKVRQKVDVTELKKIAKLQIIKYKRK